MVPDHARTSLIEIYIFIAERTCSVINLKLLVDILVLSFDHHRLETTRISANNRSPFVQNEQSLNFQPVQSLQLGL